MRNLSVMEQKQVVGGGYGFKAFQPGGFEIYRNFTFESEKAASAERSQMMKDHPTWTFTEVSQR